MDPTQPIPSPAQAEEIKPLSLGSSAAAPSAPVAATPNDAEQSVIRLPIVRRLPGKTGAGRMVAIYDDHIMMGVCRRTFSLAESMLTVEGETELTANLRGSRRLEFTEIAAVKIHPGKLFHSFLLRANSGKDMRFSLLKEQAGHVGTFLRAKLADKVPMHRVWASRTTSVLVVLLGLVGGLATLNMVNLDQRGLGALVGLVALAVTVAGFWLWFAPGTPWTQLDTAKNAPRHPARHAVVLAKPPLRSKTLGWTLKICGLAYWFLLYSPLTDPLRDALDAVSNAQAQSYIWAFLWFPAPLMIFTGYRLCQRRYIPKQGGDSRKPILFLRPFQDDEHTSLQPTGFTAQATGIRSQSRYVRRGQTDIFDLLWSAHPIRVLRMIADYGAGSSEESIARFFERHGPVIAIGKPGEHLASPGAARMYLTDDTWQGAILAEMERAQAVVMQPAPSDGVRWELMHLREKVAPCRLLLCLIGYWNNPEAYEELSAVVADTLRVDLPRVIPYLDRPAFVYFDEGWKPHVQELSYKDPVLWPVTSDGADLKYSLAPFVGGMQGGAHQPPRPARWIGGLKRWVASMAAIVLGMVLLVVPNAVLMLSGEAVKMAAGGKSVFSTLTKPSPEAVARSPRITLHGNAVGYQIQIPEAMTELKPDNAMVEHWSKTPDGRFVVQVITDKQPEDLADLPQQRLQANQEGALSAQLDSSRAFEQDGAHCVESQITVNLKGGVSVKEITRGAVIPAGTVLIALHIVHSPDSDAVYQKLAEETLQSFRFEAAAAK